MGYDSRIYIIRKSDQPKVEGYGYAEIMAVYEMRVFPPFQDFFDEYPATKFAFYSQCDCETLVLEDQYGESLREASIEDVLDCLEQALAVGSDTANYPRIAPLKAMLEEFEKIQDSWYRLAVLHYGH